MKRFVAIASILFGLTLLDSCIKCDNNDEFFNVESISISNFDCNEYSCLNESDTVSINNYSISIDLTTVIAQNNSFVFSLNPLYAFDCEDPIIAIKDRVKKISISSKYDLNTSLKAGDELKSYFNPVGIYNNIVEDLWKYEGVKTLEDAFNNLMSDSEHLNPNSINLFSIYMEDEVYSKEQVFTIEFEFVSGETIITETETIFIKD